MLTQQYQPNRWSCMATAFAMVLDISVQELIEHVGHDGSEVICPIENDRALMRGFSAQECISAALTKGFACTQIELFPALIYPNGHKKVVTFPPNASSFSGNWARFSGHISASRGVIAGNGKEHGHAVAYEFGSVYDPNGTPYFFTQGACETRHF